MPLSPDRDDISVFVRTLFQRARPGTWVNLRAFTDRGEESRTYNTDNWASIALQQDPATEQITNFDEVVVASYALAADCANAPLRVVFCPPVATFNSRGSTTEDNVANGLAIIIECDHHPQAAVEKLENLLGPATLVVASGGLWLDPDTNQENEKLHAYWRLDSPTTTPEEHALLRDARKLAAAYVDSDTSSGPISHPIRWAGSWHRKASPRLARIISIHDTDINLVAALTDLRNTKTTNNGAGDSGILIEAAIENIRSALEQIPNTAATDWPTWNNYGMATFNASGASREGLELFIEWSDKSPKHKLQTCNERWKHYHTSPPDRIGVSWLYRRAKEFNPKWKIPTPENVPPGAYQRDSNGRVIPNRANIVIALKRHKVVLSHDEFASRDLMNNKPCTDSEILREWFRIEQEEHFRPSKEYFHDAWHDIALDNVFHPVKDYLNSRRWDGLSRMATWLTAYGEAPDTDYVRAVSRLILLGAVERIFSEGSKFDEVLVFVSKLQGNNKSSAVRTLAKYDDWFSDSINMSVSEKEVLEGLQGKWIVELPELSGMRQRDLDHIKKFLSQQEDRARLAYDRYRTDRKRTSIFFGTTNDLEFLSDDTNRRFWPVEVGKFDLKKLEADVDQLWAEAVHIYKTENPSTRLDPALYDAATIEQEKFRQYDFTEIKLEAHFGINTGWNGHVFKEDVCTMLGFRLSNTGAQLRALNRTMQRFGWSAGAAPRTGGPQQVCWKRGTEKEQYKRIYIYSNNLDYPNKSQDPDWEITYETSEERTRRMRHPYHPDAPGGNGGFPF